MIRPEKGLLRQALFFLREFYSLYYGEIHYIFGGIIMKKSTVWQLITWAAVACGALSAYKTGWYNAKNYYDYIGKI